MMEEEPELAEEDAEEEEAAEADPMPAGFDTANAIAEFELV